MPVSIRFEQVLQGLRALATQNWRRLKVELQTYAALRGRSSVRLADFVYDQPLELKDIYRSGTGQGRSGWTALKRDAGLIIAEPRPEEDYFSRRFGDLPHVDDPRRLDLMAAIGANQAQAEVLDAQRVLGLQMLAYLIDGRHEQAAGHQAFAERLKRHPAIASELVELSGLLQARGTLGAKVFPGLEDTPLSLHAAYGAREVLTAVGWLTATRRAPFQSGVLPLSSRKTELLFVTLDESEGYHDRISYNDYAISAERFHWQTQNSAAPDTTGGRRYLESSTNGWQFKLFVWPHKGDAYRACGRVMLESAEGDRPMSIVWKLETPQPARLFREYGVLRGV